MNKKELLVEYKQVVKALTDIQNYCEQQPDCEICEIQACCHGAKYFGRVPALWEVEKILK